MTNASDTVKPSNPANAEAKPVADRIRIPMSVPMRKLEAPEIPGYHTHWVKESNVSRALQAWYEFVDEKEVPLNQHGVGTDKSISGNTDLGSHISIVAGIGANGQPERLILMKLKEEYWLADRKKIDERNAQIMGSIFRGETILDKGPVSQDVKEHRYVDPERTYRREPPLFSRKRAKT
jgi:hypothetical protein